MLYQFMPLCAPYHAAVRRSLRAFPTTPICNILAESGLPSLSERVEYMTAGLIYKVLSCNNDHLYKITINAANRKCFPKRLSALYHVVVWARKMSIHFKPTRQIRSKCPPWLLSNSSFVNCFQDYRKENTCGLIYRQIFLQHKRELNQKSFKFIFTDGSKTNFSTSFAVISEDLQVLRKGLLHNHCSTFSSEIFAIYQAALIASKKKGKFCICTDSQSAIDAVRNFNNNSAVVTHVRDLLVKQTNKIKLMWIPGHCGIKGNEFADYVAKSVHKEPALHFDVLEKADLKRLIKQYLHNKALLKWNEYFHHYATINPFRVMPTYPPESKHTDILLFSRLRLGHTQITHSYLLNSGDASCCFCGSSRTSVKHILDECTQFTNTRRRIFGTALPSQLLVNTTLSNVNTISNFLELCNIAHLI